MNKDYYEILGVEKTATKDDIKKSYRKLAMKYHPDRNKGSKDAEKQFKLISEAYSILSDDSKRRQYDTYGQVGGGFGGAAGADMGGMDFGDIFESFFGGGGGFGGGASRRDPNVIPGEDLEYTLNISLKEAIYGVKKKIHFKKHVACKTCDGAGGEGKKTCGICNGHGKVTTTKQTMFGIMQQTVVCPECGGTGEVFEKVCEDCHGKKRNIIDHEYSVDVPAGVDDGMVLKMQGEGSQGIQARDGDLYIRIATPLQEKGLRREGMDLHYEMKLDVLEAILGTHKDLQIPILGKRTIKVPAGTQPMSIIKLTGDGVKSVQSDTKGDLHIHVTIEIPKKLTKTERESYEQLATEKKIPYTTKKGILQKIFGE